MPCGERSARPDLTCGIDRSVSTQAHNRRDGESYPWFMSSSARRAIAIGRNLLTCAAAGFACGAILGALYVLIGWLPGAMTTFAEHPQFADPRDSLLAWCTTYTFVCGGVGFVVGIMIGALKTTAPARSRVRLSRGPQLHDPQLGQSSEPRTGCASGGLR